MVTSRIVVLTGATLGAACGLPPYRGLGHRPQDVRPASLADLYERPRATWQYLGDLRRAVVAASPGPAHEMLAALATQDDVTVVTENLDDLHERAGSPIVHHLAGNLFTTRCTNHLCAMHPFHDPSSPGGIPTCADCGSTLRPDVVLFGEPVPRPVQRAVDAALARADLLLVVGTTLAATGTSGVVRRARELTLATLWLTEHADPASAAAVDRVVEGDLGAGLARLLDSLTFAR